jgi:rhomboid protease GluP
LKNTFQDTPLNSIESHTSYYPGYTSIARKYQVNSEYLANTCNQLDPLMSKPPTPQFYQYYPTPNQQFRLHSPLQTHANKTSSFKLTLDSPFLLLFLSISLILLAQEISPFAPHLDSTFFALPPFSHCRYRPWWFLKLLTHPLAHASPSHCFNNFKHIILLHPSQEYLYSTRAILVLYVAAASVCGAFHWLFGARNTALLGSSGYLFALIGLHAGSTVRTGGEVPLTFPLTVLIFVGEELYHGATKEDGVSRLTHVVGGAVGIGFSIMYGMLFEPSQPLLALKKKPS